MPLKKVKNLLGSLAALTALSCVLFLIVDIAKKPALILMAVFALAFFAVWVSCCKCPICKAHLPIRGGGLWSNHCPHCGASITGA